MIIGRIHSTFVETDLKVLEACQDAVESLPVTGCFKVLLSQSKPSLEKHKRNQVFHSQFVELGLVKTVQIRFGNKHWIVFSLINRAEQAAENHNAGSMEEPSQLTSVLGSG